MRNVFLVILAAWLGLVAASADAQYIRCTTSGEFPHVVLREPQLTPPDAVLDRLRAIASVQGRQATQEAADKLFYDIGAALVDAGDSAAAWRLAQALAPSPGALDAAALGRMAELDAMQYLLRANLQPKARCEAARSIVARLTWNKPPDRAAVHYVAGVSGCPSSVLRELNSAEPPKIEIVQPDTQTVPRIVPVRRMIEVLRQQVGFVCDPARPGCLPEIPGVLAGQAFEAEKQGDGSAAEDVIRRLPYRHTRLNLMSELVAMALDKSELAVARKYLLLSLEDLRLADTTDRRWVFYRREPFANNCAFSDKSRTVREFRIATEVSVLKETPWNWCDRTSLGFSALRAALAGESEIAGLIAEMLRHQTAAASMDNDDDVDRLRGIDAQSQMAALFLAAGRRNDAEAILDQMVDLVRTTGHPPMRVVPFIVLWGGTSHMERMAAYRGADHHASWRAFQTAWMVGAVLKGDPEEVRRALAAIPEGEDRTSALAGGLLAAASLSVKPSTSIADLTYAEYVRVASGQPRFGGDLARALDRYGFRSLAVSTATLFLDQSARAAAWPDAHRDMTWSVIDLREWSVRLEVAWLLSRAVTTTDRARVIRVVAQVVAYAGSFADLAHMQDVLDRADPLEPDIAMAWLAITHTYARRGDLLTATDASCRIPLQGRGVQQGGFDQLVRDWQSSLPRSTP